MAVATVKPAANDMPTITTVFLGVDGLHHARCGQPMAFLRKRVGLDVAHDVVLHDDLGLVVLDVPVRDRGEQPGHPAATRDDAPAAIDQRPALGRVERLALLHGATAYLEHLLVGRRPGHDPPERVAVEHHARLPPHVFARLPPDADPAP